MDHYVCIADYTKIRHYAYDLYWSDLAYNAYGIYADGNKA